MKTKLIILALVLCSFADDVLTTFNVDTKQINSYLFDATKSNYFEFKKDIVDKARRLPVSMQVACARQLVRLAKDYTQSDAFARDYKKYRNERLYGKRRGFHIPKPSELVDKTVDKMFKRSDAETSLPADPVVLVRQRLEEFMQVSATLDFDAKTNGREFVDDQYRAKSNQWKMYYRAGKPVIDAVRDEVKIWLESIK